MRYLLDTDHISILQRPSALEFSAVTARLAASAAAGVAFPIVAFHEQVLGCQTYLGRAKSTADWVLGYATLGRVLVAFRRHRVMLFDSIAGLEFDRLRLRRVRISSMDLRIAAIALASGLIVVTRNHSDFAQVPGLAIEDWTK